MIILIALWLVIAAVQAQSMAGQIKLVGTDTSAEDLFGASIALHKETLVIGAIANDEKGANAGAVYVFVRRDGVWQQQAKLLASDGAINDQFGFSIDIEDDTVVVGAIRNDHTSANAGAAYIFTRTGETWTQEAKLTANDAAVNDLFGYSVALAGNTIVIGSIQDDGAGDDAGAAYVFSRSNGQWTQQTKLTASDAAADDKFGRSVSTDGDAIAVGAYHADVDAANTGAVYVFSRSDNRWVQQTKLTANDAAANDQFGESVALDGDTLAVGAWLADVTMTSAAVLQENAGAAYIFARSDNGWFQQAKVTAADGRGEDRFGFRLALDGTRVLIGARGDDHHDESPGTARLPNVPSVDGEDAGAAYLFTRRNALWTQTRKLTAPDATANDHYGISVTIVGDTLAVGAEQAPSGNADTDGGAVYVTTLDTPIAAFSTDPTCGQAPLTVTFTDMSTSAAGIDTWQWAFGDGGVSTVQNPTHTFTNSGTYTVTLTVSGEAGTSSIIKRAVVVADADRFYYLPSILR